MPPRRLLSPMLPRRLGLACALLLALEALAPLPAAAETLGVVAVAPPPGPGPELVAITVALQRDLAERRPGTLDAARTRDRMTGPAAAAAVADLERALDSARLAYLAGQWERSLAQLRSVADDAEKLPDEPEVFALWSKVVTRIARTELDLGRPEAARPWIARLVRAAPELRFDPGLHPTRLIEELERARAAQASAPTATLTVTSTAPGARVRVSGRDVGPAPAHVVLVHGGYRVSGATGTARVGPVPVDVGAGGAEVVLDLAIAEAMRPELGPGLALGPADRARRVVGAGLQLGVDQLVAVGLAEEGGASYVVASLHDVRRATLERECRVRRTDGALPAGAIAAIADFIVTGRSASGLVETFGEPSATVVASVRAPPAAPAPPAPPRAAAEEPRAAIVSLALRLGWAAAQGDADTRLNMGEWIGAQIPVQLDVLVHVGRKLSLGAYGAYGFGRAGSQVSRLCDRPGAQCSLMVLRAGLQAQWAFDGNARGPWLGAGAGYEWNAFHTEDGTLAGGQDVLFRGLEIVNLQFGNDWQVSPSFSLGPYLMASGGFYDRVHRRAAGVTTDGSASGDFHAWFQLGVRGRLEL